jgi:hypothetical protein
MKFPDLCAEIGPGGDFLRAGRLASAIHPPSEALGFGRRGSV